MARFRRGTINLILIALGAIAAVVVAVIAVIGLWKEPNTTVTFSGPVIMTYEPRETKVEISFVLTIQNTGNRDDVIDTGTARLTNLSLPSGTGFIPLGKSDFVLSENDQRSPLPISIPREQTKVFTCILMLQPGGLSGQVINTPGELVLCAHIFANKRRYTQGFCFKADGALLKSKTRVSHQFYSVTCSGESCP